MLVNTTFHKLDLFPSSGEGGRHLFCRVPSAQFQILRNFSSIFRNTFSRTMKKQFLRGPSKGPNPSLRTKTDPVSGKLSSLVFRIPEHGQSLSGIHHRQTPSDST
jgi:hypothetical protein